MNYCEIQNSWNAKLSGYLKHASDHQSGLFPFAWHYLWEHFLNNFPQIFPVIFPINHHGKFILSYSKFISYLLFCIYSTLNKDLHSFIHSFIFIYKKFSFRYSFRAFSYFFMIYATVTDYEKHLFSFLMMRFIVAFLFFIQSGESIYDAPQLGFI